MTTQTTMAAIVYKIS